MTLSPLQAAFHKGWLGWGARQPQRHFLFRTNLSLFNAGAASHWQSPFRMQLLIPLLTVVPLYLVGCSAARLLCWLPYRLGRIALHCTYRPLCHRREYLCRFKSNSFLTSLQQSQISVHDNKDPYLLVNWRPFTTCWARRSSHTIHHIHTNILLQPYLYHRTLWMNVFSTFHTSQLIRLCQCAHGTNELQSKFICRN